MEETPAETATQAPQQSEDEQIQQIFSILCDITGSEIKLSAAADGGKVQPAFDINGVISKIVALSVYCGMNTPNSFGPSYNRVHADIEYWKKIFQK